MSYALALAGSLSCYNFCLPQILNLHIWLLRGLRRRQT
jgi:hypothetical protein